MKRVLAFVAVLTVLAAGTWASKTELFVRTQPGGVFTVTNEGLTTGNIWWVDSGSSTGSDAAGYGQNPDAPTLTIDYAVGLATASNGDRIYAMPGHVESVIAGGTLTLDKAGIEVIFLGEGANRARISFSTAVGADVEVDAANVTLRNPLFVAAIDALTGPIDVDAADFTVLNGEWRDAAGIDTTDCVVADGNADRMVIDGWKYVRGDEAGTQKESHIQVAAAADVVLRNIQVTGDFDTGIVENGTAWDEALLDNLVLENLAPGPVVTVAFAAAAEGTMRRSDLRVASGATCVDATNDMQFYSVLCTGTDATRGISVGTAIAGDPEAQALKIDGAALVAAPTADSLAAFIASGGTALGTELGDSASLIDAVGFDGVARVTATAGMLSAANGTTFTTTSSVRSDEIPDNTQTAAAITAASSGGALILHQVIAQCDATGWANPTNFEFSTDNAAGVTGIVTPIVLEVAASFGANKTFIATIDGTTKILPMVLETGKKMFVHGDDAAGTGAGICSVYLHWERAADGANVAAADLLP